MVLLVGVDKFIKNIYNIIVKYCIVDSYYHTVFLFRIIKNNIV